MHEKLLGGQETGLAVVPRIADHNALVVADFSAFSWIVQVAAHRIGDLVLGRVNPVARTKA
jgi:hypothetical protein